MRAAIGSRSAACYRWHSRIVGTYLFSWDLNATNTSSLESTHTRQTIPGWFGGVTLGPEGELLVTNSERNTLDVLNGTTLQTVDEIPIGVIPYGTIYNPTSGLVYVCEYYQNSVVVMSRTPIELPTYDGESGSGEPAAPALEVGVQGGTTLGSSPRSRRSSQERGRPAPRG